jgi:hypothetical protein
MTFRFARLDEYPKISEFLRRFWAEDHIYCRNVRLFDWTFRRTDQWDGDSYCVSLAEEDGKLAGILGGIPFRFNRFGKSSRGVWIVNYVIRPEYRRGPWALQLLGQFRKPEFETVVAFGINPATTAIYRVLHGRVLDEIPRQFLVLPGAIERTAHFLQLSRPDWTAQRSREVADSFVLQRRRKPPGAGREIPSSWDEEEWPAVAQEIVGAARDGAYLTWRYRQHPVFEYRFLTVPEGKRSGLAVWRLETIQRRTSEGRADVDRIGRLLEFLPASASNANALFDAFVHDLENANAIGADFYCYHSRTRQWLQQLGFQETTQHPDGHAIPSRYQPLDGKGGEILSAMFAETDLPACTASSDCSWYWTKSDSDQDRPN